MQDQPLVIDPWPHRQQLKKNERVQKGNEKGNEDERGIIFREGGKRGEKESEGKSDRIEENNLIAAIEVKNNERET